jgi:ribosomal protein S25
MRTIIIPSVVNADRDLPANAKLLYGEMFNREYDEISCFSIMTNKQLAELCNIKEDTVYRLLRKLNKKGYIRIEYENEGTPFKERKIRLLVDPYDHFAVRV